MPATAQTNDKIEVELFTLRRAVERDAEMITNELVSLLFYCKATTSQTLETLIAIVICCVLLGISVLKKLFIGADSVCGMVQRSKTAKQNAARDVEAGQKFTF